MAMTHASVFSGIGGTQMAHAANTYSKYFNSQSILDSTRGNVPQ